jgi:indole-3-glycerol phosphate synthase
MSILQKIINHKKEELEHSKSRTPFRELRERALDSEPPRGFKAAIKRRRDEPIKLIAEIKRASPSKGVIREDFNLSEIVSVYDEKDVKAISVLTDERFFSGRLDYLSTVRGMTGKPLLRKDFIIDEYQVFESRACGADAILLIVAALDGSQLPDLLGLSNELSLATLVEVHSHNDLEVALRCNAEIIGINNRDLKTLGVDLKTTYELVKEIPEEKIIVSESGINSRNDIEAIESAGADAVLVGTTIMKSDDMGGEIDELIGHSSQGV